VYISGLACRFSRVTHLFCGDLFWKNFEDGPWKWDSSGRYAGSGINPGHYFAFSGTEARSEILHYVDDKTALEKDYKLLVVHGEINDVLDLTSVDNIRALAGELGVLNDPYDILVQLITASTGGTYFTDAFGAYAYERGYAGIMFFSARNISERQRSDLQSEYYHEDDALIFKSFTATEMFSEPRNRCVVLFNGAETVRSIRRYYNSGLKTEHNPYCGMPAEAIFKRSERYDASYQAERRLYRGCPCLLTGTKRCLRCAIMEAQS